VCFHWVIWHYLFPITSLVVEEGSHLFHTVHLIFVDNVVSVGNKKAMELTKSWNILVNAPLDCYYYVKFWSSLLPHYISLLILKIWSQFKNLTTCDIQSLYHLLTYHFLIDYCIINPSQKVSSYSMYLPFCLLHANLQSHTQLPCSIEFGFLNQIVKGSNSYLPKNYYNNIITNNKNY